MCVKREEAMSTLKLVDKLRYPASNISSTESDIDIRLPKAWTGIDRLLIYWKSKISIKSITDKIIKWYSFQAVAV